MNQISDYTDEPNLSTNDFKPNFDLVSPEEIQYFSETLLHDFEELNRKSFIFGLPIPQKVAELRKWMEDNLHPQLQLSEIEASFFHDILVIRMVIKKWRKRKARIFVFVFRGWKVRERSSQKCSSMWMWIDIDLVILSIPSLHANNINSFSLPFNFQQISSHFTSLGTKTHVH